MPTAPERVREWRRPDDDGLLECIVELQEEERRRYERLRPGADMSAEYLAYIRAQCEACHGTVLVADVGGRVAGFATILTRVPFESPDDPPGTYALVADLIVRAEFRRQGLGAELLAVAERYARSAGATELRVNVLSNNRDAVLLYRGAGFGALEETLFKRLDAPVRAPALPPSFEPRAAEPAPTLLRRLSSVVFRKQRRPESYYEPRRHDFTTGCIVIAGVAGAFYAGATRWELMSDANAGFTSGFAKYQAAVAVGAVAFAIAGGVIGWVLGFAWEQWHRRRRKRH